MKRLAFVALLVAGSWGCQGGPRVVSFTADRNDVQAGDVVTVTYETANATSVQIDPGALKLPPGKHHLQVTPQETVELTLTASRAAPFVKRLTGQAKLTLRVTPRAAVVTMAAVPDQILPGASTTLSWDATPATSVTLASETAAVGTFPAKGSVTVTPGTTTLYTLQAQMPNDPQLATAAVRVRVASPPSVHLSSDKSITNAGDPVLLSWTGTGATGFSLDQGIGYLGGATSLAVRPSQTTTYTVTAFGPAGGTATDRVTITVNAVAGTRVLHYTDPAASSAPLKLVQDASSSTTTLLVLKIVTTQAVQAGGLALRLPLDATRVRLDANQTGDVSPGFSVNAAALDPGSAPAAAKAVLGTGPLAGNLVLAVAQKATSPGVVPDQALAAGTELCRLRLVVAPGTSPGTVFDGTAAAATYFGHLPRAMPPQAGKLALGTLTVD